jgi:PEGA domain
MRIRTSCTLAILFSACAALAAQQAPKEELQQFVVLQSDRLVTSFESLTNEQAKCAISGAANFATMRCQAPGGTAKASYHYVTSLVVDRQGKGYVIACHESLVNVWCKRFTPGVAIQGSFTSGQQSLFIADGQKLHPYQTLTSASVGQLPSQPAPPSAKAATPRAEPTTPAPATASSSSNVTPAAGSASKTTSEASSSSTGPSSGPSLATCAAPAASCVNFVSEPPGADIYVDGKFVGNTPSSLALPAGSHEIRVEAGKFKPWTRTLDSTAGSTVTIHATLAKK